MTEDELKNRVREWLKKLSELIRNNEYDLAEQFFEKDVFGFGTIAREYLSLEDWRFNQWEKCWKNTKNFNFDLDDFRCVVSSDKSLIVVRTTWSSTGIKPNGSEFPREGRSTIVLKNNSDSLKGIHNHYSVIPKAFPEDF